MAVKHGIKRSTLIGAVVLAASATSATSAHADPTCITAYEQTQTLRKDGKPAAAKAQASICAKDSCPALLTRDCNRWLAELETLIPTIILDPRAPGGGLRADVRVKLDGAALPEKIDGKPIAVEPGSHTLVFEAEGAATVERTLVLHEGEKNKKITVQMLAPVERPVSARPVPIGVWIFGGASVFALATSAAFAIDGLLKKSDLDACKPRCSSQDVDAMSTSFTYADVALGAGVMASAAAVYLLLTRPVVEASSPGTIAGSARAVPFAGPMPGGGAVGLSARF